MSSGLVAKIHVAKKALRLDDDTYRTLLFNVTGKDSCKDMSVGELQKVMKVLEGKGFVTTVRSPQPPLKRGAKTDKPRKKVDNDPRLGKIWALWYQLRDMGEVEGSATALNTWLHRQLGIENMSWIKEAADFERAIEGLKAWVARVEVF
jgi:phage gp16-like protein